MIDGTVRKCVQCQQENLKGRCLVDLMDRENYVIADHATLGHWVDRDMSEAVILKCAK